MKPGPRSFERYALSLLLRNGLEPDSIPLNHFYFMERKRERERERERDDCLIWTCIVFLGPLYIYI
jgi:hypothetical protein